MLYGAQGSIVQVVRNDRIETKAIKIGLFYGREAQIQEGLAPGEIVVARAGGFLREGDRVGPVLVEAPN